MSNRIDQLEYTVMELGSQVFKLKQEVTSLNQSNESIVNIIKMLRSVLDEKGILESEDFDLMSELHRLIDQFEGPLDQDDSEQALPKSGLH